MVSVNDEGGYGRFGVYSRVELERFFHLDDEDRRLIAARRRDYNRLDFTLQVVTVRHLGMFLPDPLDVPPKLVEYLAEQLGIEDPSLQGLPGLDVRREFQVGGIQLWSGPHKRQRTPERSAGPRDVGRDFDHERVDQRQGHRAFVLAESVQRGFADLFGPRTPGLLRAEPAAQIPACTC